jgi:hypothetical protein
MAITDWYWKPTLPKSTDGSDEMLWDFVWNSRNRTHTVPNVLNAASGDEDISTGTSPGTGFTTGMLVPTVNTAPQSLDVVPIDTLASFQKHGRLTLVFNNVNPGTRREPVGLWGFQPAFDLGFLFYIQDAGTDTINQPLAPDSKNPRGCFIFRVEGSNGQTTGNVSLRAVPWDQGEPLTPDAGTLLFSAAVPFIFHIVSIEWVTNFGSNQVLSSDFTAPDQPIIDFVFRYSGPNTRELFTQTTLGLFSLDYTNINVGDDENLNRGRPGNLNAGLVEPLGVEMFRGTPVGWNGMVWELLGSDEIVEIIISEDWELGPNPPPVLIHEETWEPEAFLSTFTAEINEDWETA